MADHEPGNESHASSRDALEHEIAYGLVAALLQATGGKIVAMHPNARFGAQRLDLSLKLKIPVEGQSPLAMTLAIEIVRQAYPRDISAAMWRLQQALASLSKDSPPIIPMIAAQSLSPGAKDLLRENKVAYFDLQGTLSLRWRHWIIDVQQTAAPATPKPLRGQIGLFTDARACVIHALMLSKRRWLGVNEVAEAAQVSAYTCSTVLQELERREWCEAEGRGPSLRRRLVKPNALLDAWAEAWQRRKDERSHWYLFAQRQDDLLKDLANRLARRPSTIAWAFTGAAPANEIAPHLTSVTGVEVIVPRGFGETFAKEMKLEHADKGYNVTFVERDPASLLFREKQPDGAMFASPVVLYLDLLNGRGRNKELALHLREKLELGTDGD